MINNMQILNPQIRELAESLANSPCPTKTEVILAMTLSYNMGKSDGAIEACNKFLNKLEPAK